MLLHATRAIWSLPNLPDPLRYKNPSCDTHPQSARNHSSDRLSSFYEGKQSEKKKTTWEFRFVAQDGVLKRKHAVGPKHLFSNISTKKELEDHQKIPCKEYHTTSFVSMLGRDSSTISTIWGDLDWGRYILITKIPSKTVPCFCFSTLRH